MNEHRSSEKRGDSWLIRLGTAEWDFRLDRDGWVLITYGSGPFGLPVGSIRMAPEVVLSFCKCLRSAARAAKRSRK